MNQFIKKCKNTKFCIGVMSKNCVDTIIDFCVDKNMSMIFIPSRRQIEYTGGYVNNWTTDGFCKYVRTNIQSHNVQNQNVPNQKIQEQNIQKQNVPNKTIQKPTNNILLERDHGGCHQGAMPDDGIESLKYDCKDGNFDIVHIDPWLRYNDRNNRNDLNNGIAETIKLIKICYNENPNIYFEVGTEERIRYFTVEELDNFMQELQKQLPGEIYQRIIYLVIQCGTHLHENGNIGTYDKQRLIDMLSICKKYNVMSKEHNGDYVSTDILHEKLSLGIDSINIAPEFGQIETSALLDILNSVDIETFFDICYRSGKWRKWVNENFDPFENKKTLILICGHYVFSTDEFKTLIQPYNQHMVNSAIRKKIIEKMEQLWTVSNFFIDEHSMNEHFTNEHSMNKTSIDNHLNMWDIVSNDHMTLHLIKHDIENFRRNGLVNGIEIGLLYSERQQTIKNRYEYLSQIDQSNRTEQNNQTKYETDKTGLLPGQYVNDYSIKLQKRFENLSQIVGKKFIIENMECVIGNPQHGNPQQSNLQHENPQQSNPSTNPSTNLNTNELYSVYDCWQILHCLKYSFITSLQNETPLSILEIGGGFGSLATKLLKNIIANNPSLSNVTYYSVDLPEILQLQEYYFKKYFNELNIPIEIITNYIKRDRESDGESNEGKSEGEKSDRETSELKPKSKITIILMKPEDIDNLTIYTKFDIAIQCRGFSEMNHETLQKYFSCIQKRIDHNGLFYLGCQRYVAYRGQETMRIRDYPFDNSWTIMKSQPSWLATHGHDMALTRSYEAHMPFTEVLKSFPIITPPPGPLYLYENTHNITKWIDDNRVPKDDLL